MVQINQIKIAISSFDEEKSIENAIAKKLNINPNDILSFSIIKKSIDARKKPDIFYILSAVIELDKALEKKLLSRSKNNNDIFEYKKASYKVNTISNYCGNKPVIIGAGPAGLFAAYILALSGMKPCVLERGKAIEDRTSDVKKFWETGILDTGSNVQFGEGGAGAFSDGKLNTLVKDKFGRNAFVLNTFVKFGANENILYDPKPHVGTDVLVDVVSNLRNEIIKLGGEFHFESQVTDFVVKDNSVVGVNVNNSNIIDTDNVILAIGHSARDTFYSLYNKNVSMKAKEFAVGFRIEHPQSFIGLNQYGDMYKTLPAAPYKLATNLKNGRGVYSFCMCPGGFVVNSSSEEGRMTVNGMSYSKRDSNNANSAIVVSVGEKEFDLENPLSGIEFQRKIEELAYKKGKGAVPQQLLNDFINDKKSEAYGSFLSEIKGKSKLTNLRGILPSELEESLIEGLRDFDHKIKGFLMDDAILSGVESRTSSPVRIVRDENFYSNIKGLIPCGEGAGYAGGIMSAAMDGMKCAEKLMENIR